MFRMTRFLALCFTVAALAVGAGMASAQSPDDLYLRIYFLIQDGDTLAEQSRAGEALPKYIEARQALDRFQKGYPEWNQDVIRFRTVYVASRIAELQSRLAPRVSTPPANLPAPKASTNLPQPERVDANSALLEAQVTALRSDLSHMRADNANLESKLKEALAAQPAAVDPRELTKAEGRVRELQKGNELLTAALSEAQEKQADTNAVTRAQKALEEAQRELAAQRKAAAVAQKSKVELEERFQAAVQQAEFASALRTENDLLKKQLAEGQNVTSQAGASAQELSRVRVELAALRSERDILANEKKALEERIRTTSPAPVAAPTAQRPEVVRAQDKIRNAEMSDLRDQVKRLEKERVSLRKQLESAAKQTIPRKSKAAAARIQDLERQLASMRDRLAPLEATKIPYTKTELALMSVPGVNIPTAASRRSSDTNSSQLSASTASLITDARRSFAARQFDSAAEKFAGVIKEDENNVPALGGLAISEMERARLPEAEAAIRKAIALAPENATVHSTLGQIKFRQQDFDAAYEALSKAAALDPNNAEVQNLLGVTLSQKGQRGPAETALRRAIQLQPNYGSAHNNLAIIYVGAQPPLVELARWHYQKALASGHPRNADLEAMLTKSNSGQ